MLATWQGNNKESTPFNLYFCPSNFCKLSLLWRYRQKPDFFGTRPIMKAYLTIFSLILFKRTDFFKRSQISTRKHQVRHPWLLCAPFERPQFFYTLYRLGCGTIHSNMARREDWKRCLMKFSSLLSPSDLLHYTRFYVLLPRFSH